MAGFMNIELRRGFTAALRQHALLLRFQLRKARRFIENGAMRVASKHVILSSHILQQRACKPHSGLPTLHHTCIDTSFMIQQVRGCHFMWLAFIDTYRNSVNQEVHGIEGNEGNSSEIQSTYVLVVVTYTNVVIVLTIHTHLTDIYLHVIFPYSHYSSPPPNNWN